MNQTKSILFGLVN